MYKSEIYKFFKGKRNERENQSPIYAFGNSMNNNRYNMLYFLKYVKILLHIVAL